MEVKKTVSLEINGKTYDFRFYEETRCEDPEKTVCEQFCPLCSICDKTPDPRHYIDPKKYDGSLNDFCLNPNDQVYNAEPSVILTLDKHAGEIVSKDQLLKYLNSEDSIDRCVRLDLMKETSDGNFEIIDNFSEWSSKKEHLLDKEDRDFIHSDAMIGDDGFLGDLIPFQEDVEKYIKEVVECNGN